MGLALIMYSYNLMQPVRFLHVQVNLYGIFLVSNGKLPKVC